MTIIACLATDHTPVLIADSLVSSIDGRENFTLPTVGKLHSRIRSLTPYKAYGTIEKLVVLSENAIVAWAGDCEKAKRIIAGIRNLFGDQPMSEKFVMGYLDANFPELIPESKVSLMFLIKEGQQTTFRSYNCWRTNYPGFGAVSLAGTGRDDFLDSLDQIIPSVLQIGDVGQRVVGAALGVAATLLATELFTGATIAKGFGGSYEIGGIFGGEVTKFTDYCCIFWQINDREPNSLGAPRKIIRSYLREGNVCNYAAEFGYDGRAEITKEEVFVTLPLLADKNPQGGFEVPDLNAQFQVNVFFPAGSAAGGKIRTILEYRHTRENHVIGFASEGDELEMRIDGKRLGALMTKER